jgi:hypothetical protein
MRPNPVAPWELRIGDLRVYYEVKGEPQLTVTILAIGIKERDQGEGSSPNRGRKNQVMTRVEFKNDPIRNADEETVTLSTNRKFMKIIERSRARVKKQGGIPAGELRRRLGLTK